jgi:hypothetical protein
MHHKHKKLCWIAIETESQRPIARIEDCELRDARVYSQRKYGPGVWLTAWRHASDQQRSIAGKFGATFVSELDNLVAAAQIMRLPAVLNAAVVKTSERGLRPSAVEVEKAAQALRLKWKGERSMAAGGGS